jgi:hypothetical protein
VPIGPGEVKPVGQDGDGPNAVQAQAAGPVEVEGRVAPEAQPLVDADRGGHELGGVQAQHGRAGRPRPLQAGLDQRLTDPGPPRRPLHPERPQPGPAGRPPEPLQAGVGVEGDRAHDPAAVAGHQHPAGPEPPLDVEDVGQVPPEHGRRERLRILLVGIQQHPPDLRQLGPPSVTNLDPGTADRRHHQPTVPTPTGQHIGNGCLSAHLPLCPRGLCVLGDRALGDTASPGLCVPASASPGRASPGTAGVGSPGGGA